MRHLLIVIVHGLVSLLGSSFQETAGSSFQETAGSSFQETALVSPEAELVNFLLNRGYDPNTRPVLNESYLTILNISINSFHLLEITWKDPYMTWDADFYNITWVKLKESSIWKPDVTVSTSVEISFLLPEDVRYVDVKSDGTVQQSYYAVFLNACPMQVSAFPYDVQVCEVNTGPWTYTDTEVETVSGSPIMQASSDFKGNSEWEFISIVPRQIKEEDTDISFNYTALLWVVTIKRKPQFYIWVLLVPTFIITSVSICGVFIPSNQMGEREEKVTLGLTTLLSTAVILEIVASTMPKASALPLLGNFILAEIFITAVAVLASVAVLFFHHRAVTRKWEPSPTVLSLSKFPFYRDAVHPFSDFETLSARSERLLPTEPVNEKVSEIENLLLLVTESIDREEREQENELVWHQLFDRIDFFLLLFFQMANVIITVLIV